MNKQVGVMLQKLPVNSSSTMGLQIFLTRGLFTTRGFSLTYSQISFPVSTHCKKERFISHLSLAHTQPSMTKYK